MLAVCAHPACTRSGQPPLLSCTWARISFRGHTHTHAHTHTHTVPDPPIPVLVIQLALGPTHELPVRAQIRNTRVSTWVSWAARMQTFFSECLHVSSCSFMQLKSLTMCRALLPCRNPQLYCNLNVQPTSIMAGLGLLWSAYIMVDCLRIPYH